MRNLGPRTRNTKPKLTRTRNTKHGTENQDPTCPVFSFRPPLRVPNLFTKVTDFGLAKFIEAGADLTHTGQIVGTPQYMGAGASLVVRSKSARKPTCMRSARFCLNRLAGRPPFIGSEPMSVLVKVINEQPPHVRSLRPDVPRDLAAVTMKCLEKQPDRRYAECRALANDLRRFLDNRPTAPARSRFPSKSGCGRHAIPPSRV